MTKLVIFAANGQIARIVTDRILKEKAFADVDLTLALRNSQRLSDLSGQSRVRILETDLTKAADVDAAVKGQDIVFVAMVDQSTDNIMTRNVITAMKAAHVERVISTNALGIYDEVPGEFGRWNQEQVGDGLVIARESDRLLAASGLDYTTLRLPWLNDRDEVKYELTHRDDTYVGVSGSRQSMADVVLRIVADPTFASKDSLGIADPATQGEDRPVY